MSAPAHRALLPTTGLGRVGAVTALLGLAALVALIATDVGQTGPDERPGYWVAWLVITVSGALLLAALWRGERAVVALVALVPFALFVILLLMELTGLME